MWPFKREKELPLIDLVEYEALLIRLRGSGVPLPRMVPGDQMGEVKYTPAEWKKIEDNQLVADEIWRRYTEQKDQILKQSAGQ